MVAMVVEPTWLGSVSIGKGSRGRGDVSCTLASGLLHW